MTRFAALQRSSPELVSYRCEPKSLGKKEKITTHGKLRQEFETKADANSFTFCCWTGPLQLNLLVVVVVVVVYLFVCLFCFADACVMDSSQLGPSSLHLIAVLGDVLARVQAIHAKEEYGLSQIVSSIKFVNRTVDAWIKSSQEQPEPSEYHVYESNLSEMSKSIDAILGEARFVRNEPKHAATAKGSLVTPDNTKMPRKSKAAEHNKTLERFSHALHMRPTKMVTASEAGQEPEQSTLSAAHELLLKWMETGKGGWTMKHTEKRRDGVAWRQSSCASDDDPEKLRSERSNAARRKFLDSLWSIQNTPAGSETKAEDAAAGCDLDQTGSGNDDSSTSSIQMQIKTTTQNMQKNVKELQAYCKLFHEQNPQLELLSLGRFSYPYTKDSSKMILQRRPQPENQRKSAANDDSWLPAEFCWNILGKQAEAILTEFKSRESTTSYSNLQQAVSTTRLMHSLHTNLFHCHLQIILGRDFLLVLSQPSSRCDAVWGSASGYKCLAMAHSVVCRHGRSLMSIARRMWILLSQEVLGLPAGKKRLFPLPA
nr:uncharacterized protein LOC112273155 isoform X2 [Physcomitrium patens]|eukprot:XP_024357395.1 uncharacterized protein LOC112273155 isoform X2 [Physcomitrella patens]